MSDSDGFSESDLLHKIKHARDINAIMDDGNALLHHATEFNTSLVQTVLQKDNVDVNIRNSDGQTPLSWAIYEGNIPVARLLLQFRADPNIILEKGNTLIHTAACNEDPGVLAFLHLFSELPLTAVNAAAENALHITAESNFYTSTAWLLDNGADPLRSDQAKRLPIHLAAREGNLDVLNLLLQRAPIEQLSFRDTSNQSPEDIATEAAKSVIREFQKWQKGDGYVSIVNSLSGGVTKLPSSKASTAFYVQAFLAIFHFFGTSFAYFYFPRSMIYYAFLISSVLTGLAFYITKRQPPGYLPKRSATEEASLRDQDFERLLGEGKTDAICVLSRVVKPWRAIYCKEVDRCVRRFDHFSVILGAPIGLGNILHYFAFCVLETHTIVLFFYLCFSHLDSNSPTEDLYISCVFAVQSGLAAVYFFTITFLAFQNLRKNQTIYDSSKRFLLPWYSSSGKSLYDFGLKENVRKLWNREETLNGLMPNSNTSNSVKLPVRPVG